MTGLALVTGASSGLGRAMALELARRGYRVVLLARDAARLDETRLAAEALGGRAVSVSADVRDPRALRDALETACGDAPLRIVVHAAGMLRLGSLSGLDEDAVREMLDVNVVGAVAVVRAALPRLRAAGGHVVLIASIAGRMALPGGFTGYGASKWALRGWAEIARPELEALGVGLTVAYPSILDTSMVSAQRGPDAPSVYRAFPWHSPAQAATRILDDASLGRPESFVTPSDRLAAWAAGAMPRIFHAGLRVVLRARGGRTER